MTLITRKLNASACAALLSMVLAAPPVFAEQGAVQADQLTFRVLLDDREIGKHRFVISPEAGGTQVHSEARFDVRVLGIPVYRYRHENTEKWGDDGCLRGISSRTTANGDRYQVDGRRDEDVFRVETGSEPFEFDGDCVMSFAYWDRAFLQASRLLNSQTGEYLDVRVEPLGDKQWSRNGSSVSAQGFRIVAEGTDTTDATDIRVFYASEDGRWLGLESRVANDRLLAYVRADEDA
ncbi:MAG: hypothetical protein JJU27_06405 [Gammaproteobacteria bacterium]|nr:hypothetical protein [Gammaproteobacteria bacterium]